MLEREFDLVAENYNTQHARSIKLSGEDGDYFSAYKIADVRSALSKRGYEPKRIMDFGAGIGNSLVPMRQSFPDAHITCLDVSEKSLELCRKISVTNVDFCCYDGNTIPFKENSFDLIFTACVFHHIPPNLHRRLMKEIRRVLSPSGFFILFEHNPWNPLTQHAVRSCPFDANAQLINASKMRRRLKESGFKNTETHFRIFFPKKLSILRSVEPFLKQIPLGAQYYILSQ